MTFGYLGVGQMGQPMAGKLLDAGHELWVYDVRREAMRPLLERQAREASSPKALGDACDTVFVSLPTLDIFRAAVAGPEGLLAGRAIKTLVNTCTVGRPFCREIEAACAAHGVTLVDAPISGGPAGARAGSLTTMVAGDPAVVAALQPAFEAWGPKVVRAGDVAGAAQVMKLTNNILFAVSLIATSEAITMSRKGGIDDRAMLEVLNNGSGRNFSTMLVFPDNIVPGTYDFGATFDIIMKDIDLAIALGEDLGVPMWVAQSVRLAFKHAVFEGRGQQDLSRIIEVVEAGTRAR